MSIKDNTVLLQSLLDTVNSLPNTRGSVQADWNQTNDTAPDFIKNKPFGDFHTTIYEATGLEPVEDSGTFMLEVSADFTLTVGQQYTVIIDGNEFICEGNDFYEVACYLGNPAILGDGEDNGFPFCMIQMDSAFTVLSLADFDAIVISTNEPLQIDSKYIKTGIVYVDNNRLYRSPFVSMECRLTKAELQELIKSCSSIVIYNKGTYHTVIHIYFVNDYGIVQALTTTTNEFKFVNYYTAEYVEETTT